MRHETLHARTVRGCGAPLNWRSGWIPASAPLNRPQSGLTVDGTLGSQCNPSIAQTFHQKTDDELWLMLDQPTLWLIYGGGVLAEEDTLRKAVYRAHELSSRGSSISEIVRTPGEAIVIPTEQIRRLWMRLDLTGEHAQAHEPANKFLPEKKPKGPAGRKSGKSKLTRRPKRKPTR